MPLRSPKHDKPLWRCPRCGKYYVTKNMWHACARHTVNEHFEHRDPKLRFLFSGIVGLLKRNGSLKINPDKTGIAFQVRMRFCGVYVRKNSLDLGFLLPHRLAYWRVRKIVPHSPRCYSHHVTITTPADLDDELASWLKESYRVGAQADLLLDRKRKPHAQDHLAWSRLSEEKTILPALPEKARPVSDRGSVAKKRASQPWRCPKCSRRFPVRNQIHSCSRLTLSEALRGKTSQTIALFERLSAVIRRFGSLEIVPQKTRIAFQARKIFLGVRFLRDAIDCEIALPRRIEDPRFRQILSVSPGIHYHYLPIFSPKEIDSAARRVLHEAFRSAQ